MTIKIHIVWEAELDSSFVQKIAQYYGKSKLKTKIALLAMEAKFVALSTRDFFPFIGITKEICSILKLILLFTTQLTCTNLQR